MPFKSVGAFVAVMVAGAHVSSSVEAFVLPSSTSSVRQNTHTVASFSSSSALALSSPTLSGQDPQNPLDSATKDIPYGEKSRQYRRTVYSHEDWVKHRNPNRFIKNIATIVNSGIYKVRTAVFMFTFCFQNKKNKNKID